MPVSRFQTVVMGAAALVAATAPAMAQNRANAPGQVQSAPQERSTPERPRRDRPSNGVSLGSVFSAVSQGVDLLARAQSARDGAADDVRTPTPPPPSGLLLPAIQKYGDHPQPEPDIITGDGPGAGPDAIRTRPPAAQADYLLKIEGIDGGGADDD